MSPHIPKFTVTDGTLIRIDATFHYDWFWIKQPNKLRIKDSHNMVKLLIDVIAKKVGFDDCRTKTGSWASVHTKGESFVEVTLTEIPESEWRSWS